MRVAQNYVKEKRILYHIALESLLFYFMENLSDDEEAPAQVELPVVQRESVMDDRVTENARMNSNVHHEVPNDIESNIPAPDVQKPVKALNEVVRDFKMKPNDVVRTETLKALEARKRRLERQAVSQMPEIHFVGQVASGSNMLTDSSEGVFCRCCTSVCRQCVLLL
jgi:hypothetical protein